LVFLASSHIYMKVFSELNHSYNPPKSPFKKGGLKKSGIYPPFLKGGRGD
jgi:hypothetical protein